MEERPCCVCSEGRNKEFIRGEGGREWVAVCGRKGSCRAYSEEEDN